MESKDLQEIAEDVVPVEETASENDVELTPEQKEAQEKMFRGIFANRWKHIFRDIEAQKDVHGYTISDLKDQIEKGNCNLSRSEREFVSGYDTEFLEQCLNELYKGRRYL